MLKHKKVSDILRGTVFQMFFPTFTPYITSEYGFSLIPVFPYKDRIKDDVLKKENRGQRKPVFWHILCRVCLTLFLTHKFGFY